MTAEPSVAAPTAFLDELENRVHEATERIRALREENDTLRTENEQLENRIESLESRLAEDGDDGGSAWAEERDEIRERVEALVEHLETLLTDE